VDGRTIEQLETSLAHSEGRENVRLITLDMSDALQELRATRLLHDWD
jgi:hypothetical protein